MASIKPCTLLKVLVQLLRPFIKSYSYSSGPVKEPYATLSGPIGPSLSLSARTLRGGTLPPAQLEYVGGGSSASHASLAIGVRGFKGIWDLSGQALGVWGKGFRVQALGVIEGYLEDHGT